MHDCCDACGAAAVVRVFRKQITGMLPMEIVPRYLHFCGHHYRNHEDKLENTGWRVETDERQAA